MAQRVETDIYYPESDGQPISETDLHRRLLTDLVFALAHFFAHRLDVYVTGNLFIYYVKGKPSQVVCPDVCVVIGAAKAERRIYQTWQDGPFPQVVIELTSDSTRAEDEGRKSELYEREGVLEYYLFDPRFDPGSLAVVGDLKRYRRATRDVPFGAAELAAPGLAFTVRGRELRLVEEATGRLLPTPDEEAAARQMAEETAAQEAAHAQAEAAARMEAEARAQALAAEVARLRAQLEGRSDQ
jgi:Putative restriction endonuclease